VNQKIIALAAWILALCAWGCATPVGVKQVSEKKAYRQITRNAISDQQPSAYSNQLIARLALGDKFHKDPQGTLAELHAGLGGPDETDRLFALAELSFSHALRVRDPQYFLAAAVYAYIFLFPVDYAQEPSRYDPRLRLAMELYNRGLAQGLRETRNGEVDLTARQLTLPFGKLELSVDPAGFSYGGYQLTNFVSVGEFEIHGLRNHYRKPGIGVPLSARGKTMAGHADSPWLSSRLKAPVTAIIRFDAPRRALSSGQLRGTIELYDVDVTPKVKIDGYNVPFEYDPTATLAYGLNDSPLWDFEIAGFRRGDFTLFGAKSEGALFFLSPYRPGRIPVVFVHGTASSPARWAELSNELLSDPNVAGKYQFWYFIYNSGNPIALSAMHLRENLQAALKEADPQGKDPALQKMVVIGHSQGGLLTKMTAVSSGTKFWDNVTSESFDKAKLSDSTRDLLRRSLFVEPLPFVKRLVFIATPHHGSYMAEDFIGKFSRRFISLPAAISKSSLELFKLNPLGAAKLVLRFPTAIDNMDSANPFLKTLASLPIAPGVHTNSIIPVKGKGPVEKGNDGVVRYASAHIEPVESELIVRSGHSCQSNPHTIEEVRRILYEHAKE
jgi:pimeloyl-ACP methyl ester carboxylesterase